MNGQDISKLVESEGAQSVAMKLGTLFREEKVEPEQFSLREAWEAFCGPVNRTLPNANAHTRSGFVSQPLVEEVRSTSFAYVTGSVLARSVMKAYNAVPSVLDKLVTKQASSLRHEPMQGFQAFTGIEDVPEGGEYPDTGFEDKATMNPEPAKRGLQISVTDEAVLYDRTGQLLGKAAGIGRTMQNDREKHGMYRVQDLTGYKSFYPMVGGTPTQTDIFRASAAGAAWYNITVNQTAANALVDWTDIDAAMLLFSAMLDEASEPITIAPREVLVPYALWSTILRVLGATSIKGTAGTNTEMLGPNVIPQAVGGTLTPLTSVFMNDATSWFIGDFKSQYVEREIWPIQLATLPRDATKDILIGYRARRKSQVEAVSDKYVVRCPAS